MSQKQPVAHRLVEGSTNPERAWLNWFRVSILLLVVVFAIAVAWLDRAKSPSVELPAYVALELKTTVSDGNFLISSLQLATPKERGEELATWLPQLRVTAAAVLSNLYADGRPALEVTRKQLLRAFNKALPDDLEVQEVLIEKLLVGTS